MTKAFNFLASILLILPLTSHALPPEFTAVYLAETHGITAARATYKLKHKDNGIFFTQHSETIGLAALISNSKLDEASSLSMHDNRLLLDSYHYIQKGGKKNRNIRLKIKWHNTLDDKLSGTINGVADGKPFIINLDTPVWDTLTLQIPIMMTATEKTEPQELKILVDGELETYLFVTHGFEEIDLNDKVIKTIKIERQSDNKDKPLYFWLAPSLNNLPVKIEKWKKGKPNITMLLDSASFPSDKNIQYRTEEDFDDL